MEPNASPTLNPAAEPAVAAAGAPAANRRFLYAGGTRPLEGYTIKRGVGQGGFGEIYYAVSDSGKEVALKLIRRNLEVELRGIRQCLNLKHPNLLNLFDIRQDDNGDTWVVMEYVGGMSLQDAIDAQPNGMPIDEALSWIHGIASAVAYLHDHGIVHRDLKPANIFSDDGVVKVGDYGLSKFISCSRRSGHTESIGTVHYMAPEVANGRYGKEIDVYALGIILYELLTGGVPFDGESVGEVLMKHLTAQPDVTLLPEPYRDIVAKAMQKDPEQRYHSANEFLAALPPPSAMLPGTSRVAAASRGPIERAEYHGDASPLPLGEGTGVSPDDRETIVAAVAVDEEPILRALRTGWQKVRTDWNRANMPPGVKTLIMVGLVIVLILSWNVWLPMGICALVLYGFYRFIRWIVLAASPPNLSKPAEACLATPPELAKTIATPSAAAQAAARPSVRDRDRWRRPYEKSLPALVLRSPRERVTDLLGSLIKSALVAAPLVVVMTFILGFEIESRPEQMAWLYLITVAGSWTVLTISKFWEGTKGESLPRRFVMMILGLGLGTLAFVLAGYYFVDLPQLYRELHFNNPVPANFFGADGRPLLPAFAVIFGALFFAVGWWKQADPLRSKRLSISSLAVSIFVAGIVASFGHFPQPWMLLLAGAISIAVQLSSPWLHPRERAALRRG
jgi:hypothetical protein